MRAASREVEELPARLVAAETAAQRGGWQTRSTCEVAGGWCRDAGDRAAVPRGLPAGLPGGGGDEVQY
jgi:hypothetical protein